MIEIKTFGDSALLVNFEQRIDEEINAKVGALTKAIKSANIEGVQNCLPAYCSVLVNYNPLVVQFGFLKEVIFHIFNSVKIKKK